MTAGRDHIKSLLSPPKIRCPTHNEPIQLLKADGQIVFYCGCTHKCPHEWHYVINQVSIKLKHCRICGLIKREK